MRAIALLLVFTSVAFAQDDPPSAVHNNPMTVERLGQIITNVDDEAALNGSTWLFAVEQHDVAVVYDEAADRMRIVIPIGPVDDLPEGELLRLMQANFDSALDARYAIANNMLWGTYIHPLRALSDEQFLEALGQTVNVVRSFGTSYSSGLLLFGGGDSGELQQQLIEELRRQGTRT